MDAVVIEVGVVMGIVIVGRRVRKTMSLRMMVDVVDMGTSG